MTEGILDRAGLQPPDGHRPPRHQAGQRDAHRPRRRQGDGLRHRPRHRRHRGDDDADPVGHRHRAVPLARAGAGHHGRRPLRPLLHRLPALRAAHRAAAVRRRLPGVDRLPARRRGAAASVAAPARDPPDARRGRPARPGQGPRGPLPGRRGCSAPTCRPPAPGARSARRRRGTAAGGDGTRLLSRSGDATMALGTAAATQAVAVDGATAVRAATGPAATAGNTADLPVGRAATRSRTRASGTEPATSC